MRGVELSTQAVILLLTALRLHVSLSLPKALRFLRYKTTLKSLTCSVFYGLGLQIKKFTFMTELPIT